MPFASDKSSSRNVLSRYAHANDMERGFQSVIRDFPHSRRIWRTHQVRPLYSWRSPRGLVPKPGFLAGLKSQPCCRMSQVVGAKPRCRIKLFSGPSSAMSSILPPPIIHVEWYLRKRSRSSFIRDSVYSISARMYVFLIAVKNLCHGAHLPSIYRSGHGLQPGLELIANGELISQCPGGISFDTTTPLSRSTHTLTKGSAYR